METCTAEPTTKKFTQHVRVRITAKDLETYRHALINTDRSNAVTRAINRTLRPGYAATFDGLSVGIIRTGSGQDDYVPSYEDPTSPMIYTDGDGKRYWRLQEKPGMTFYRGVDKRVQSIQRLNRAHRRTAPQRVTVSLPTSVLKRTVVPSTEPLS